MERSAQIRADRGALARPGVETPTFSTPAAIRRISSAHRRRSTRSSGSARRFSKSSMTTSRAHSSVAEGRRQRDEGNANFLERNPSRVEQIPNQAERNPNEILGFPSPNRALSMGYADPRPFRLFVFLGRFRASKAPLERWRCLFAPDLSFLIVSGSSGILKQRERLAPFRSCTCCTLFAQLGGREPHGRGTGNAGVQWAYARDPGEKDRRSIRCPARIRPLKKSPIRLEPLASGRRASPSCR